MYSLLRGPPKNRCGVELKLVTSVTQSRGGTRRTLRCSGSDMGTLGTEVAEAQAAKQAVPEAKDECKEKTKVAAGIHEKSSWYSLQNH